MEKLIVANSIREVNMSNLKLPIIVVDWHPDDFPECCVARVFDADQPTNVVILRRNLEEIERDIRKNTGFTFLPRGSEDPLSVVGVWM